MDTLWIRELSFLYILCFYISLINTSEYVTTICYSDEYTTNISCRNKSQIQIKNIDVQEEESICRKNTCYLNSIDKHSIQDNCNGEHSCLIDFNFTSTCLREEFRYMNLSYTCRHENGTGISTFEEDFGEWRNKSSKNYKWQRSSVFKDHTRETEGHLGYSINTISYNSSAGTARIITDIEFMRPICLSLWYQYLSTCVDMDCFFNIYHTSDSKETLLFRENGTSIDPGKWYNISVDVNGIGPYKIMLEAVFNNNKSKATEAISVDDTSIAYRPCKGEEIHTTCLDLSTPVIIECETQFLVGDIKLSLGPKYKTDCQEKAIETDLNNVCRNIFNKSEHCYYSVFERMNKSEDCYDFTKNVSLKYLCIDMDFPVQNDIKGIAAGVSGGVVLTIIVVVVICLIKRSKPGKQEASSTNDNKAFGELQNDDHSKTKINLSQSPSQDIITSTDTNLHKPVQLAQDGQESADFYNMSNEDGTYDASSNDRQRGNPNDNNIYSHTADNIYDSGSHHKLTDRNDETYDHFFGQQTEDEYDTTART
ncbi:uncharacterized protein LOC134725210 isoform X2 [Mytilus trossulus]|uniref:uncharacterized protein LOC134725210 isoform X2 n=1 Tax=Mytilus trossulus TaxID=6551 RepID=UPI003004F433